VRQEQQAAAEDKTSARFGLIDVSTNSIILDYRYDEWGVTLSEGCLGEDVNLVAMVWRSTLMTLLLALPLPDKSTPWRERSSYDHPGSLGIPVHGPPSVAVHE
jgi:hypothetical protein